MGITNRQAIKALSQDLARASREFHSDVDREMEKLVPFAEEKMVHYSDMQKGRISENMVNAMKAEYEPSGFRLRYGFIGNTPLYMKLQTVTGFTHIGGSFIAPSLAIKDASEDIRRETNQTISRIRRNFMQRLRRRG